MFSVFDPWKVLVAWCALQLTIVRASQSQTCYRLDGSPWPHDDLPHADGTIDSWISCNPDQAASHCCNGADLCLDNGLCMHFETSGHYGDRLFTLQGCTDADWRPPCPQYFAENRLTTPGARNGPILYLCSYENDGEYCVGDPAIDGDLYGNASCCADASKRIKTIPWFKSMHLALDPTKKIEYWDAKSSNGNGKISGLGVSNSLALGAGAVAFLGVVVAFCQWQYPSLRFKRRKVDDAEKLANASRQTGAGDSVTRLRDENYDIELQAGEGASYRDSPRESYSDGTMHPVEVEDGWREQ